MGVLKNDVGRPSNKTIKTRNILKGIMLIVIVILAFGIGYYFNNKKEVIKDAQKGQNNNTSAEKKIISNDYANEIMENVFGDWEALMVYGGTDAFNKDEYKTFAAISLTNSKTSVSKKYWICDAFECKDKKENEYSYTAITVNNHDYDINFYQNMFRYNDVEKTFKRNFKTGKLVKNEVNLAWLSYFYSKEKDVYAEFVFDGGDGPGPVIGIQQAYKVKNKLYIVIAYGELEYTDNEEYVVLDNDKKIIVGDYEYDYDKIVSEYGTHLENYELEFEESDGNYLFVNSKKIK